METRNQQKLKSGQQKIHLIMILSVITIVISFLTIFFSFRTTNRFGDFGGYGFDALMNGAFAVGLFVGSILHFVLLFFLYNGSLPIHRLLTIGLGFSAVTGLFTFFTSFSNLLAFALNVSRFIILLLPDTRYYVNVHSVTKTHQAVLTQESRFAMKSRTVQPNRPPYQGQTPGMPPQNIPPQQGNPNVPPQSLPPYQGQAPSMPPQNLPPQQGNPNMPPQNFAPQQPNPYALPQRPQPPVQPPVTVPEEPISTQNELSESPLRISEDPSITPLNLQKNEPTPLVEAEKTEITESTDTPTE